jgi:hypothetical protein
MVLHESSGAPLQGHEHIEAEAVDVAEAEAPGFLYILVLVHPDQGLHAIT